MYRDKPDHVRSARRLSRSRYVQSQRWNVHESCSSGRYIMSQWPLRSWRMRRRRRCWRWWRSRWRRWRRRNEWLGWKFKWNGWKRRFLVVQQFDQLGRNGRRGRRLDGNTAARRELQLQSSWEKRCTVIALGGLAARFGLPQCVTPCQTRLNDPL